MAAALWRAKRKLAQGGRLSALEQETVEDELAYREGREFWRLIEDQVVQVIIPRWVPDGFLAPRRSILEQLAAAQSNVAP
jgi:hypothetical protein